jgi:serine protease Do
MRPVLFIALTLFASLPAHAGNEELAKQIKPSLVAIYPAGREGAEAGVGSGFVISEDGLIATNFHVIGEGRALRVEFPDGTSREVTAIHASDRTRDLAVIRVAGPLPRLELGDSATVEQGTPAITMGNPLGYRFSIVEGLISARQEVEGRTMLQLAMPVERGNSGGPVLNKDGKVIGIVTLKSSVTANLGFAVPVNDLKSLLEKPNPVAMKNWLTIGALNPKTWQIPAAGGTRWSQRAGVLQARGMGEGFGGRTQCLATAPPPPVPYEISVRVKLEDESGAAGLAFCADGGDIHYGFYPTNGGLRLTKFQGPDISSWSILENAPCPHYQSGQWNHLRVRVETDRVICYLNDHVLFTNTDTALRTGAAGLCQFRGTAADFRDFRIGTDLGSSSTAASPALRAAIQSLASGAEADPPIREALTADPSAARALAAAEAAALEKRAATLRRVAAEATEADTVARLAKLAAAGDSAIPLAEAALLLARLDNPELDPAPYLLEIDRMATELETSLTETDRTNPETKLAALNRWLFAENGFHGSRDDFSNKSNSYLNEVIDDREGLPITLAVLHMELARRLGLEVAGIPLPGRFITQLRLPGHPEGGPYIDVFEGGRVLTRQEAAAMVLETTTTLPETSAWEPAEKRTILVRMLNNLTNEAVTAEDTARLLRYLAAGIALEPDQANPRLQRFYLLTRAGRRAEAREDAAWLLEHRPPGTDEGKLKEMLEGL